MNRNSYDIIIRADADVNIGKGHLIRTKTLFNHLLKKNIKTKFIVVDNPVSREVLKSIDNVLFIQPNKRLEMNNWPESNLYIIDLYEYNDNFYYKLKENSKCQKTFLFDDDIRELPDSIDGVINHNIYANQDSYKRKDLIKLCGSKFFILRPEVRTYQTTRNSRSKNIFICMGGSDPEKQTYRIAKIARENSSLKIDVVLGEPDEEMIKKCRDLENIEIHINPVDFVKIMRNAKYAISGGGTLAYELAYNGIPSILIELAKNQEKIAAAFHKKHVAINIGKHYEAINDKLASTIVNMESSDQLLKKLSENASQLIDGKGVERLSSELINFVS